MPTELTTKQRAVVIAKRRVADSAELLRLAQLAYDRATHDLYRARLDLPRDEYLAELESEFVNA